MEFISSDTNVWVDFATIDRLALPFKLPYIYLMDEDAVNDELIYPEGLKEQLLKLGLRTVELTEEEFFFAESYGQRYRRLSVYDSIALAIARCRGITLLTGDGPLRKVAMQEGVKVIGSLGVLDKLFKFELIDSSEYLFCLEEFKSHNGGRIRLPIAALEERIESVKNFK